MTRLFVRFYVGVLIVLFLAWYIHGAVLTQRAAKELARVIREAHRGGAHLVASKLDSVSTEGRDHVLDELLQRFDYPVTVIPITELPNSVQARLLDGDDVVYSAEQHSIVAKLSTSEEVVRLGPFPDYDRESIEDSIKGWMLLAAEKLESCEAEQQQEVLAELQTQFDFPISVELREDLPAEPQRRIGEGAAVAFYERTNEGWFAATPLSDQTVVRSGPFPNYKRIEQNAATTTLALVLLPAALAIALLLRPIAQQLRHVENAAKAIAGGDLGARVDERRTFSAKPLAQAFNNMADRTETLVRTQRELLQAVSHELRTPLSRIRFAIDLIESAKDDSERRQRLDSLDNATEELDQLVSELLRYVRMETAEVCLERETVAVQEVLRLVIRRYAALYPKITFCETDDTQNRDATVFADRQGFQRVIGNLISNAGRFAKHTVTITVSSQGTTTTIDVNDDGCGIASAKRERVFEPFVRLNNQTSSNGRGVGLGLALVHRIINQHGGTVEVLTSPLGGCCIRTSWLMNGEIE